MSIPPSFEPLIEELTRDVVRVQPRDLLQFCSNWFNLRLEEQRTRMKDALLDTTRGIPVPLDLLTLNDSALGASSGLGQGLGPGIGNLPNLSNQSPRGSIVGEGGAPLLKNPFAPQNQHHTYAPPPPSNIQRRAFGSVHQSKAGPGQSPFLTINEDEAFSPTAFANPFGGSSSLAADDQGPFDGSPFNKNDSLFPPPGLLGRRISVSAESIVPGHDNSSPLPHHPKNPNQISRIKAAIKENFIFRDIEEKQLQSVLNAMEEMHVLDGEIVIRQGDQGDYFYVVESGRLFVYITSESLPASITRQQAKEQGSLAGYHPIFGKKVAENGPGTSFGELALMYGHPRAASVVAVEECTVWRLDRMSFRRIILKAAHTRRTMYEEFLHTVPLLSNLSTEERSKIADALMSRVLEDGEAVIEEGQMGDTFYFVEEGEAIVTKKTKEDGSDETVEKTVKQYRKGDYFGELALLRMEPRAATVRAVVRENQSQPKLKVAALGVAAFTRLLGPLKDIMERNAGEAYGIRVN